MLTPDIFPALAATKSDRTGEIQLTNGLRELLKSRPIYACEVKGVRHDTGNKLGFLKAVVYFALRRPDLAEKFAEYLAVAEGCQAQPAGVRLWRTLRISGGSAAELASCRVLVAALAFDSGLRVAVRLVAPRRPCRLVGLRRRDAAESFRA